MNHARQVTPMNAPNPLWIGTLLLVGCSSETVVESADTFTVKRGDLAIRVTEQAEIQPFQKTRIKNEMEGQTTVIYLIEEGVQVEKGEKLVELDASSLLERKATQGIALHRAEATRETASKELEIRQKEYIEAKLGGENRVRIADIDLQKFLGKDNEDGTRDMGEQQQQLIEAEANIQLAKEEVTLAKNKLEWSNKLHVKGFITKDELERDELDHQRRQKNLKVAENELEILENFSHPKELIRLQQAKREAETDLEGIIARSEARLSHRPRPTSKPAARSTTWRSSATRTSRPKSTTRSSTRRRRASWSTPPRAAAIAASRTSSRKAPRCASGRR